MPNFSRRAALKAGFLGVAGLSLADALAARAASKSTPKAKSAILIWLDGGPSHLESYDPKPDAPKEYRGPFGVIKTPVPGTVFSELVPRQAALAKHLSVVRSMHHDNGDHFAGAHWMLTGRFGSTAVSLPQQYPSFGSYVSRLRGPNARGFPAYVGLPSAQSVYLFPGYMGAAYLGQAYNPFDVNTESRYLHHTGRAMITPPKTLTAAPGLDPERIRSRGKLLDTLDRTRRAADATRGPLGRFQQQALSMVLSPAVARAFDVNKEDQRLVERYRDKARGKYNPMARRAGGGGVPVLNR